MFKFDSVIFELERNCILLNGKKEEVYFYSKTSKKYNERIFSNVDIKLSILKFKERALNYLCNVCFSLI